ncbi:hypothetical protein DYB38_001939 [Aphanomyces astaci]|uniref:Fe2OG dioxygenase domain-containing protein n=1 Tax=Aphanomyces astaci TaxID=112090 RepID=A0A397C455_APHAT|nr:hypothetical protein DYB36_000977 [Aphanomyces astaci]RHY37160.1 hypothetical protein DYB38_001939 [Aphanomyces astaci]
MARFSSTNVAAPSRVDDDLIANFQLLLEKRQATEAMQIFQSLKKPPATALSQRLAIMLAKRATLKDTKDAIDVNPTLKPDDFTMLAFIFVSDACYRNKMLKEAVEVTEEAHNLGVRLDLPAYNNLINALVDADQTDEAILILQDIAGGDVISPDETTYAGLISAIISQREFSQAMETIDQARTSGVKFSGETYMSFMSSLADVEDDSDAMDRLLTYLETNTCKQDTNWDSLAMLDKRTWSRTMERGAPAAGPALLNVGYGRQVLRPDVRNNDRCIIDDVATASIVWDRVRPHLPSTFQGKPVVGVNERLRFLRYYPGQEFKPHCDGSYRRPDGSEQSYITIQIYLNGGDDLEGGDTVIFDRDNTIKVHPVPGRVLIFQHYNVEHSGAPVINGVKYAIRSDIMCSLNK